MKFLRVYAEYEKDKDEYPLCFDLIVDDRNRMVGDWYTCGLAGRPENDGTCWPFVLLGDGSIDFGAAFEREEERWWSTDLRTQPVKLGQAFSVSESDSEYTYRIVKVVDLGEQG
jgi:hypothetical protein